MNPSPSPDPSQAASTSGVQRVAPPDAHLQRARSSLKQAIQRYSQKLRSLKRTPQTVELQSALKTDVDRLSIALDKLNQSILRIAVFGLVSRGKSAVINALIGQKILQTGPLHGVTQYPRSVYWVPDPERPTLHAELIDTPGLDEVGGEVRAAIAQDVAHQADLILFVIAGDMTRTEYIALTELQQADKPMLLVFNKTDLYPNQDQQTIYAKLQALFAQSGEGEAFRPRMVPEDIVRVAAEPAPLQVRVEYADGGVEYEWQPCPTQIEPLRQRLVKILAEEGPSLLALNALREARNTEATLARKTLRLQKSDADDLIWRYTRWKAIAVAANPIAILDIVAGTTADLLMIRALAHLYGLPMTSYEAGKLWNAIVWSSGSLLVGEVGSNLLFGTGKSAAALSLPFSSLGGLAAYSSAAIAQASLAGYGSYRVGKAAQTYLERGCTWGAQGANTVIREILDQMDEDAIVQRLRHELQGDA